MKKIGTLCFFCENPIAKKGQDPVSLTAVGAKVIRTKKGGIVEPSQTFWCHCKCLAVRVVDLYCLHPAFGGKEIDVKKMKPSMTPFSKMIMDKYGKKSHNP